MKISQFCILPIAVLSACTSYFTDNVSPVVVSSIIVLCLAMGSIFSELKQNRINIAKLLISQTLIWYCLPWTYYYTLQDLTPIERFASTEQMASVTTELTMVCGVSYFIFSVLPITIPNPLPALGGYITRASALGMYLLFSTILQVSFISLGNWGYYTFVGVGETGQVSQYVFLLVALTVPIPIVLAHLASLSIFPLNSRFVFAALVLLQVVWFSAISRRTLLVLCMLSLFVYLRTRTTKGLVYSLKDNLGRVFLILMVVLAASIAYLQIRLGTGELNFPLQYSILDAAKLYQRNQSSLELFVNDFSSRPFSLLFSVSQVEIHRSGVLYGWNFLSQLLYSAPSFLVDKKNSVGPILEALWEKELNIPLNDWTNSLYLESRVDFSTYGFPIYLFLVATLTKLGERVSRLGGELFHILFLIVVLFMLLNVETTVTGFLTGLRNMLLFTPIFAVLFKLHAGNKSC